MSNTESKVSNREAGVDVSDSIKPRLPSRDDLLSVLDYRLEKARSAKSDAQTEQDYRVATQQIEKLTQARVDIAKVPYDQRSAVTESLQTTAQQLQEQLDQSFDPKKRDELLASMGRIGEAKRFIEAEQRNPAEQDAAYKEWYFQKRKKMFDEQWQRSEERKQRERAEAAPKIAELEKQLGIPDRKEIERRREEYIQMALRDGGVRVHTSVEKTLSPRQSAGFQNMDEGRLLNQSPYLQQLNTTEAGLIQPGAYNRDVKSGKDVLQAHHRGEFVGFRRDAGAVMEEVTIPEEKNWFGRVTKAARTERRPTGQTRSRTHADMVQGGKNEPLVWLTYSARAPEKHNRDLNWQDYSGRYGQQLLTEIALPESEARTLESALEQDPALIRHIVGRAVKEKFIPSTPERWENPPTGTSSTSTLVDGLRPPYEKWDSAAGGGKIYVQPLDAEFGWHEEYDRKIVVK